MDKCVRMSLFYSWISVRNLVIYHTLRMMNILTGSMSLFFLLLVLWRKSVYGVRIRSS